MGNKKSDILNAIGNTPIVELVNLNGNPSVKIFGKLEGNNPAGSVKDRPAYYMIKKAEESDYLPFYSPEVLEFEGTCKNHALPRIFRPNNSLNSIVEVQSIGVILVVHLEETRVTLN